MASTIRRLIFGVRGNFDDLENAGYELFIFSYWPRLALVLTIWSAVCLFCWLFVNPNLTSIHAFYRDRLAEAFILCPYGDKVVPEVGVRLSSLCNYAQGSSWAPYHLINTAVNMTTKDDKSIRDRNADFFIFSKLFCGGRYTGYIRTEQLESACPEFTAASIMAISAGAAFAKHGQVHIERADVSAFSFECSIGTLDAESVSSSNAQSNRKPSRACQLCQLLSHRYAFRAH